MSRGLFQHVRDNCARLLIAVTAALLCTAPLPASADALDDFVRAEMETRRIPGLSFAVVKGDRMVGQRAYGSADLEWKTSMSIDAVYAIGSITKSMAAIIVMMLVEEGAVTLDDTIGAHVDKLPRRWRKLTLRQLLSHTSGIEDSFENPCRHRVASGLPGDAPYSTRDALLEVSCQPLLGTPGEQFNYANQNYLLLGLLIEAKANTSFGEALKARLFDPLGMSSSRLVDHRQLIPGRAAGYAWDGEDYRNAEEMDGAVEHAAGAVLSTTGDIARFIAALGDTSLLSAQSWQDLWTTPASLKGRSPYALGFGVSPFGAVRRVGHNGAAVGFSSALSYFPEVDAGVIVLTNGYQQHLGRNVMDLANEIAARSGVLD